MRYLKRDAPAEIRATVQAIEDRADECYQHLSIIRTFSRTAIWAILTGGIRLVEREIAARGDNSRRLDAALINLSRLLPTAIKWVSKHGLTACSLVNLRHWHSDLAGSVDQAIQAAHNYDSFLTCYPMWHKNCYAVEVLSENHIRFIGTASSRERQVSAYQKGFRPTAGRFKGVPGKKVKRTYVIDHLFEAAIESCRRKGPRAFEYRDLYDLWFALLPEYHARVDEVTRRPDTLCLGAYSLREFKGFYAAFLSVCAAHEFLCPLWESKHGVFPLDSAVLVWQRPRWMNVLSTLSQLARETCSSILQDLTFDTKRSLDLNVHPVVPLDPARQTLAVAPQFPLHSRCDENILRVCSWQRPEVFDETTLGKESETVAAIQRLACRFKANGAVALPSPIPDIDLVLEDTASSTVVFVELKWSRKTLRPVERLKRDEEITKGINQLEQIRSFLQRNPDHLHATGRLTRSLDSYQHKHYLLVARDHWFWVEPTNDLAVVEFEPFSQLIQEEENLYAAVRELLKYEWLPIESRDFTVRFDTAIANGVAIDSEVFYAK